ncbi:integrator complex subunit 2 [Radiomyces spectabilis]|uniref:integrator complex subunit 2 n=1 Tax=Radiomyces spectabilis TaxID=64574 RepID=UPI0022207634|nr:integrator complex subunit 2 [Radiomyces spectabilis]KAI8377917.1 integrator complex subunit 2 [Radiomyces spectabilis]
MLNHVESYQQGKAYRNVYPDLLSLAANLYPEMFNITSFLLQEGKESDETAVEEPKEWDRFWISRLSPDKLEYILIHWQQNPDLVVKALSCIGAIDTIHIADYVDIVIRHLLPLCFNENFDDNIANAFSAVWESFDGIIPYELWVLTAKEMRDKNITNEGMYTLDNLVEDPLLLFKCDPKIFRCRRLLPIWLHLLSCIRVCSRHRIWKRFVTCFPRTQTSFNIRNVVAMINVQDAIMLQLLLEQCQEQPRDEGHADQLQQAREHICHFIHGIFVDGDRDGVLVKLLHFETYALDLIPIVVELIPSIYIVMNFIPELLRQPQPEKQIFGILIACHLCEKYPLEPYLVAAEKYVLPRLVKIAFPATREGQPTGCVPSEYLIQAIPGFVHLAKAFPHFAPQILRVFDDIFHGLPPPKDFIGQEGNTKIILFLRLHKTLKDARQLVQQQADRMESVNNVIL